MEKKRFVVWAQLLAGAAVMLCLPAALPAQSLEARAFDAIKALQGNWEGKMSDGTVVTTSFRTTAGGSAVLQMIGEGTDMEMPTLYHLDGDRLMATHYCAAQNQPRMVLEPGQDPAKALKFKFLDATNLKSPDSGHMNRVAFQFIDPDHMRLEWTYRENGKEKPEVFELVRKP
jgi:hypothetical protein